MNGFDYTILALLIYSSLIFVLNATSKDMSNTQNPYKCAYMSMRMFYSTTHATHASHWAV